VTAKTVPGVIDLVWAWLVAMVPDRLLFTLLEI
jgi:hypothetical protein